MSLFILASTGGFFYLIIVVGCALWRHVDLTFREKAQGVLALYFLVRYS